MLAHVLVLLLMYSRTAFFCKVHLVSLVCVGWHIPYAEELLMSCSIVEVRPHSFVDLSGLAWYPSCLVTSGKLPSSGLQCTLWYVGHLSAVLTI